MKKNLNKNRKRQLYGGLETACAQNSLIKCVILRARDCLRAEQPDKMRYLEG